jgi:transcriptional regulator with XRE-family HTH domain
MDFSDRLALALANESCWVPAEEAANGKASKHMAEDSTSRGVLAERLDRLIATVHPAGRGPYTLREIADAINSESGTNLISAAYISQLRTGRRTEPSHSRLAALARFFGVGIDYFSGETTTEETNRQLEVLTALRDDGVRSVALRAAGLSESSLAAVRAVIENARRLEGLPEDNDAPLARTTRILGTCRRPGNGPGRHTVPTLT